MRRAALIAALAAAALGAWLAPSRGEQPAPQVSAREAVRFETLDVVIDVGTSSLAAYQFELLASNGATIVGVEGGEARAYAEAPYYDAAALAGGRIIVGALAGEGEPTTGAARVARLHMRVEGGVAPRYECVLRVAAMADASPIGSATITVREGTSR